MQGLAVMGVLLGAMSLAALAADGDEALATVNAFRRALQGGDAEAATALLAPELLVYESGHENRSRGDYAADHVQADMAFLAGSRVRVLDQRAARHGELAWVTTRSHIAARSTESLGTETMVLRRGPQGWRIVHIHWSSHSVAKAAD